MKYWVCSATENMLPQVLVLKDSVNQHMPDYEFIHVEPPPRKGHVMRRAEMARIAKVTELLDNGAEEVITSGADYCIYGPLTALHLDVWIRNKPILLCPHFLYRFPSKPEWLRYAIEGGVFNSDFQVLRNHPNTYAFLSMLKEMNELEVPLLIGQQILAFAVKFYDAAPIEFEGYGVSYYNLHERIFRGDDTYSLKSMHFSGKKFTNGADLVTEFEYPFDRELTDFEKKIYLDYHNAVLAKTKV